MTQGMPATVDFVSRGDVLEQLQNHPDGVTVKEIGRVIGLDMTVERNIKNVSNRCGYLVQSGEAIRIAPGTYQYQERKPMETMTTENGEVAQASDPALTCKTCGFAAKSPMGLSAHNTRAHKPKATPDEMFERVGAACEVLFPDGIPYARVIEVAELQKAILKVLSR